MNNDYENYYASGIYAEGYIVFVFPFIHLYVRLFVFCLFARSFIRTSLPLVELLQTFTVRQLE